MPKYGVEFSEHRYYEEIIEAESENEALDIMSDAYGDNWDSMTIEPVDDDRQVTM